MAGLNRGGINVRMVVKVPGKKPGFALDQLSGPNQEWGSACRYTYSNKGSNPQATYPDHSMAACNRPAPTQNRRARSHPTIKSPHGSAQGFRGDEPRQQHQQLELR